MPEPESVLYVPLRSNAKTLVTGAPIAALRRRLKYASVFHDQVLLESGILRMQAGEGGSSSFVVPATEPQPARWQTPRQRQLAQQSPFQLSVGRETTPGVSAETMQPMLTSDSAISWTATLEPFAAELPAGTDWIHFGRFTKPGPSVGRMAQGWTWADQHNPYLDQAIPGRFDLSFRGGGRDRRVHRPCQVLPPPTGLRAHRDRSGPAAASGSCAFLLALQRMSSAVLESS
jgi:hypothetical protein